MPPRCSTLLKPRPQGLYLRNERLRFSSLGHRRQLILLPRSPAIAQRCPTPRFGDWRDPFLPTSGSLFRPFSYETPPLHFLLAAIGGPPAAVPSDWPPCMLVTDEIPPPAGSGVWGHCSAVLGLARLEPPPH